MDGPFISWHTWPMLRPCFRIIRTTCSLDAVSKARRNRFSVMLVCPREGKVPIAIKPGASSLAGMLVVSFLAVD
jgi:hypothetical protein